MAKIMAYWRVVLLLAFITGGTFLLGYNTLSLKYRCKGTATCSQARVFIEGDPRRQLGEMSPLSSIARDILEAEARTESTWLRNRGTKAEVPDEMSSFVRDWVKGEGKIIGDQKTQEQHQRFDEASRALTKPPKISQPPIPQGSNCSIILSRDRLVRNCITGDVIGRIPGKTKTRPYVADVIEDIFQEIPKESSSERRKSFQDIFKSRAWGYSWNPEQRGFNASGRGATLHWTQEAVAGLHVIITEIKRTLGISRVKMLDVPCGDMAWMSRFLDTRSDIDYTGVDIVPELIDHHQKQYKDRDWKFRNLDSVQAPIEEEYDLIFCRTLLQHLYFKDLQLLLDKFSNSGSKYFMATTFSTEYYNVDLEIGAENPGRFRPLNLEVPPLSLTPPKCLLREGPTVDIDAWTHFLGLWELPLQQVADCEDGKEFKLMHTGKVIYSCVEWSPYIDLGR